MDIKKNYIAFQREITKRGIQYLIHFTPTINLYGILEHKKLMSRKMLENLNIKQYDILDYIQFTDNIRYDDKNFINLSISGPNTFLLSKFREKTKDNIIINWCVLKIDPKHIYDRETKFSITNAASIVAKSIGITGDIEKFKMLFQDQLSINTFNGTKHFNRHSLHPKYPTIVQAEVLVKDEIPAKSIIEVCFDSQENLHAAKAALFAFNTHNFVVDKEIFSPNRTV